MSCTFLKTFKIPLVFDATLKLRNYLFFEYKDYCGKKMKPSQETKSYPHFPKTELDESPVSEFYSLKNH